MSIFEGNTELIKKALGLEEDQSIDHRSVCATLSPSDNITSLVFDMYRQIESNWNGRSPSNANWQLRRQTNLSVHNTSPEVLLERAIVVLADERHLEGWFNQMPIASGLLDDKADKRAAIDLIKMLPDHVEFVELKWESNTPLFAIFEILNYGLSYLFCFKNKKAFGYEGYPTMGVSRITLSTLAPSNYYANCDLSWLVATVALALNDLFGRESNGDLSCDFKCNSFPSGFDLPFKTGQDVIALMGQSKGHSPIQVLSDAMNNPCPVWSTRSR